MTREEIKNKVTAIVDDKMGFPANRIKENTSFKYDLGTDSLDEVELVMEFERKFNIRISDEEIVNVSTVGEAIDVICQKLDVSICKQQQSEVDLKEEFHRWLSKEKEEYGGEIPPYGEYGLFGIARHFYELGLNTRKKE